MRKLAAILLATAFSAAASAQPAAQRPPKLLIAISVDQLSADLWDEYRPHFTGGLARVASGTVFRNGYQSHAATETCPGHSTILTSKRPTTSGIIANVWVDQSVGREDKSVYCAEDERVPGSTSTAYTVSPAHLRGATLGDLLKARSPASRNVAVAGKDRAAVMMSGRLVDQRYYWDGKTFATDLKGVAEPRSVTAFKASLAAAIARPRAALEPPPACAAKAKPYVLSPTMTVGAGRLERAAGDARAFRISPDLDGATLALAAALVQEMGLGRGRSTDLLSVGLAATDYVGHAYGSGGLEMCLQMHALDRELGSFFGLLDRAGVDYAVVLTADHGVMDIPERLRDKGLAGAARVDPALVASEVGKLVAGRQGLPGPGLLGPGASGDFWVDRKLPAADQRRVLDGAIATYRAHPQVYAVYTKAEIARVPMPSGSPVGWTVPQRLRASFDPARSGDLLVVLKPNISPIAKPSAGYTATHGSPWDYDRRVPIAFWRRGMPASNRAEPIETTDIMPTAAAMLGLPLAGGSVEGRCLGAISTIACPVR